MVGTGSRDGNHITRVYVLPEFQGKGYGSFNELWAEYAGGEIKKGFLIGLVEENGELGFLVKW